MNRWIASDRGKNEAGARGSARLRIRKIRGRTGSPGGIGAPQRDAGPHMQVAVTTSTDSDGKSGGARVSTLSGYSGLARRILPTEKHGRRDRWPCSAQAVLHEITHDVGVAAEHHLLEDARAVGADGFGAQREASRDLLDAL